MIIAKRKMICTYFSLIRTDFSDVHALLDLKLQYSAKEPRDETPFYAISSNSRSVYFFVVASSLI
jgi:hypothetical protein